MSKTYTAADIAAAAESHDLARRAWLASPTSETADVLQAWQDRLAHMRANRERRVLRVAVAYTVEVDLDAYEEAYGTATRSDIRAEVQSAARSAFDAGLAYSDEGIAKVL